MGVQQKAMEAGGQGNKPTRQSIVASDEEMHTLWMLAYKGGEFRTLTEAIRHHRGHSGPVLWLTQSREGTPGPKTFITPPKEAEGDVKGKVGQTSAAAQWSLGIHRSSLRTMTGRATSYTSGVMRDSTTEAQHPGWPTLQSPGVPRQSPTPRES